MNSVNHVYEDIKVAKQLLEITLGELSVECGYEIFAPVIRHFFTIMHSKYNEGYNLYVYFPLESTLAERIVDIGSVLQNKIMNCEIISQARVKEIAKSKNIDLLMYYGDTRQDLRLIGFLTYEDAAWKNFYLVNY